MLLVAASSTAAIAEDWPSFPEPIVVRGTSEAKEPASFETRFTLEPEDLASLDAVSADEAFRRLPAVHVPTNSRGESIAFMRNAAERQLAVFYEGAAINVPWDNRLDLSLFPAGLIGTVRSAAGPLAPHYGVNALGAISISPGERFAAKGAFGSAGVVEGSLTVPLGSVLAGGSYAKRDGDPLSDDAALPFSQSDDSLRTNSDRKLASLFAHWSGSSGGHDLSLTAFRVWGEKGIAPESNRATGARFWRYPDVRHTLVAGSARSRLGPSTELDTSVWHQRFGQTIDNYASVKYDQVTLRQIDRDRTWGLRELLQHRTGAATLVGSFNFLQSTHRQQDIGYLGAAPPAVLPAALLYRQRDWSLGGELGYDFSDRWHGTLGIGYDRVDYVRTGDKPAVEPAHDWTGRAGLAFDAGGGWRLRGTMGRKMRAPTMRERFGEGIGRFLPNPDLEPERIWTAELGAEWQQTAGHFWVIPFIQDLKHTIDQRNVGSLRQRINLEGSRVIGLEMGVNWSVVDDLKILGTATWTRVRRKHPPAGQLNRLAEKPALTANLLLRHVRRSGLSTELEAAITGGAYSADPAGALVPLKASACVNWRVSYRPQRLERLELFLRIDNIGDTLIEPQLGLPAPGRSVRVGVTLS